MQVVDAAIQRLPEALRDDIAQQWHLFTSACSVSIEDEHHHIWQTVPKLWAVSPFVANHFRQNPEELTSLVISGDLERGFNRKDFADLLEAQLTGVENEDDLKQALRTFRRQMMMRIIWRDTMRWAKTDSTIQELSDMADVIIDEALNRLHTWFFARYGMPRDYRRYAQRLIVVALGKLGGQELNLSSDVDLMFCYPEDGILDPDEEGNQLTHQQLFTKIGQALIQTLNAMTEDGIVFRVDMRLRPFGQQGALVIHFNALRDYYANHGRDWERYAMIKARIISGHGPHAAELRGVIRDFVYHREIDIHAMAALRDMHRSIREETQKQQLDDHVKLGPGGIREIEFSAQVYQLIYGGSMVELQERRLIPVLNILAEEDFFREEGVAQLKQAYYFLRDVEHRLQAMNDQQTHTIPSDEHRQAMLALGMHYTDWQAFLPDLERHRRSVGAIFGQVLAHEEAVSPLEDPIHTHEIDHEQQDWQAVKGHIFEMGFNDAETINNRLRALVHSNAHEALTPKQKQLAEDIINYLLHIASESQAPDYALARVIDLFNGVFDNHHYLWLLHEKPKVIERLLMIANHSSWLCNLIQRYPLLLGELIYRIAPMRSHSPTELSKRLARSLRYIDSNNDDELVNCLIRFKQVHAFRIAIMDIDSTLTLLTVSDNLSHLATATIEHALTLARKRAIDTLGAPKGDPEGNRMAVIAYGRLGGLEMGYRSDCDLVFVYDDRPEEEAADAESNPAQPNVEDEAPDAQTFYVRVAQILMQWLEANTASGNVYNIDTRLRPSGASGLLVSSLSNFAEYQSKDAWTWEHQALVRARMLIAAGSLQDALENIRHDVLRQERDTAKLRQEILDMRHRMIEAANLGSNNELFNVKHSRGGITDIEFMVQYCVLNWAHQHPEMTTWSDNFRLLDHCAQFGLLNEQDCRALHDIYLQYRQFLHRKDLDMQPYTCANSYFASQRQRVLAIWHHLLVAREQ